MIGVGLTTFTYSKLAFPVLRRVFQVRPLVVYYHLVSDTNPPHIKHLYSFRNVKQFRKDLEILLKCFRPVSLQDVQSSIENGRALPPLSFLLTFDDGLRECYDVVAPELQAKGVPATFFICSAFVDNRELAFDLKKSLLVERLTQHGCSAPQSDQIRKLLPAGGATATDIKSRLLSIDYTRRSVLDPIAETLGVDFGVFLSKCQPYFTSDQVRTLIKQGHAIGAHSVDHPRYGDIPLKEQLRQTRESVRFVQGHYSVPYRVFAFPSSDANVSRDFFQQMQKDGEVDLFFGNRGMQSDFAPQIIQRVGMENSFEAPEAVLGRAYARGIWKRLIGRTQVQRN